MPDNIRQPSVWLWQIHLVHNKREAEQIFPPDGAMEAFEAAKKAGKVRYIGYTSRCDPQAHLKMLRHADRFDTALMPLHVADTVYSDSPLMSFEKTALPAARERGDGIVQNFYPMSQEEMNVLHARAGSGS